MSYVIYLRKSRADAEAESRGEGETLSRHETALSDLAQRLHLPISAIYREIVSGETIAARPVMRQLLREVETGRWEGVLVMEVERLARGDTVDQGIVAQTFKLTDTKIVTPVKTYDPANEFDEEYFEFGLFMSRREYKTINRRLQNGRLASVKEGKFAGNTPPYGYQKIKIEHDKGYTLKVVPEEAEVVKLIFDLYAYGESLPDGSRKQIGMTLIANTLNELHFLSRTGGQWKLSTIRDMLSNPTYTGKVRWNYKKTVKTVYNGKVVIKRPRHPLEEQLIVQGLHPAIISQEAFDLVQARMKRKKQRPIREHQAMQNPLCGLVICGVCGKRMQRRPYTKKAREETLICPNTSCVTVSSDLSKVENKILLALEDWVSNYRLPLDAADVKEAAPAALELKKSSLKRCEEELDKLRNQLNRVHELLELGVYSAETFSERTELILARIAERESHIKTLAVELRNDTTTPQAQLPPFPQTDLLLDVYRCLPNARAKNALLSEVLEKVVYTKEAGGRWGDPDAFKIVLYPKLPDSTAIPPP